MKLVSHNVTAYSIAPDGSLVPLVIRLWICARRAVAGGLIAIRRAAEARRRWVSGVDPARLARELL